jgi:DNA-directed RNA polymerase I and III subunit RPAC1
MGIGGDHAKFSPVATAYYRLMPQIDILKPIYGKDAEKFARCFPRGVIKLVDVTDAELKHPDFQEKRNPEEPEKILEVKAEKGDKKAVVANAMKDTVSRECLRHEEFAKKVMLGRVRDHFIFSVESVGQFESEELFIDSVKMLKTKCQRMKRSLALLKGVD